jgi:L-threonylcarbamoyladenylate synthase
MSATELDSADAKALQACLAAGGVAVFPADTVYGLACDPTNASAFQRLYELKGRPAAKPAAVMWFSVQRASEEIERLPAATARSARALLPGPVTLLLPNPLRRFPLACEPGRRRASPPKPLGLRVPAWPSSLAALAQVGVPALQSSANLSGDPAPCRLSEVPRSIRDGADLLIDGGELPGLASTVIDLCDFDATGEWSILREGACGKQEVSDRLASVSARC